MTKEKTTNRLVVIGWTGIKRAYLNVTRDEALRRYNESEDSDLPPDTNLIVEIEFVDEFGVYDAWSLTD